MESKNSFSFLEELAAQLYSDFKNKEHELTVIFPGRRASLFFKQEWQKQAEDKCWLPKTISVEDFIFQESRSSTVDELTLVFELYEVHKIIEKEDAESFDSFLSWAPILLKDFNEIDLSLVEADKLFGNLEDIKEIRLWSPDKGEHSEFEKRYLKFFSSLISYYSDFNKRLSNRNISYQGMAYRKVAENIDKIVSKYRGKTIVFAGFNAFTLAEEKIIKALKQAGIARTYFDIDRYYFDDKKQEAGNSLRRWLTENPQKELSFLKENLLKSKKSINIVGLEGTHSQAAFAAHILQDKVENIDVKTALVLSDESLLLPVLNQIPDTVSELNITMGYPLQTSALYSWINTFFDIKSKFSKQNKAVSIRVIDLQRLFFHPWFGMLIKKQNDIDDLVVDDLVPTKRFVDSGELLEHLSKQFANSSEFIDAILKPESDPEAVLNSLMAQFRILMEVFEEDNLQSAILKEGASLLYTLSKHQGDYGSLEDVKALKFAVMRILKRARISFSGEPLKGLQVMGLLESRNLDFENVILLSCNEGMLPAARNNQSFILWDLRKYFGMPGWTDQDAIFAYHFYHLIQRAQNIWCLYDTSTDGIGSSEKSRFLSQIEVELEEKNPNISINSFSYSDNLDANFTEQGIKIDKSKDVMERLLEKAEKGFSPSALNRYIKCSLQFYFSSVAGLGEEEDLTDVLDHKEIGTAIHDSLEELYTPYVGKEITGHQLEDMLEKVDEIVKSHIQSIYKSRHDLSGRNIIIQEVAIHMVKQFIYAEKESITGDKLHINSLEEELRHQMQLGSSGLNLNFLGKADRIDTYDGVLRISDYKTGTVQPKDLKWKDMMELFTTPGRDKAFQLLMYAWLYTRSKSYIGNLNAGIFSLRKSSSYLLQLEEMPGQELLEEFEAKLLQLMEEIFSEKINFEQTDDLKICEYCDYKQICGR